MRKTQNRAALFPNKLICVYKHSQECVATADFKPMSPRGGQSSHYIFCFSSMLQRRQNVEQPTKQLKSLPNEDKANAKVYCE